MKSLESVINYTLEVLKKHPERDLNRAREAALAGKKRKYPVMYIDHLGDPADTFVPQGEMELPTFEISDPHESKLAGELLSKLVPLKMLNPVCLDFGLGKGPGTLVSCFGIPLDPETEDCPAFTKSIEDVLSQPLPNPKTSGLMPEILKKIRIIKALTPDTLKIALPDTQGAFNIAHSLVGEEALIEAYLNPDRFHQLMEKITDFWIQCVTVLKEVIGSDRETVWDRALRLRECSVNLISPEMYKEFVLPYDLKMTGAFSPLGIHTCSGAHVFYATLENIPGIAYTEAGHIECATAGFTEVAEAITAIQGKDILLNIGQELPEGKELELIKSDLDYYLQTKRLLFCYNGMHWRKKDRPLIREIHRAADAYWNEKILSNSALECQEK